MKLNINTMGFIRYENDYYVLCRHWYGETPVI